MLPEPRSTVLSDVLRACIRARRLDPVDTTELAVLARLKAAAQGIPAAAAKWTA